MMLQFYRIKVWGSLSERRKSDFHGHVIIDARIVDRPFGRARGVTVTWHLARVADAGSNLAGSTAPVFRGAGSVGSESKDSFLQK